MNQNTGDVKYFSLIGEEENGENIHTMVFQDGMDYHMLQREYWGWRTVPDTQKELSEFIALSLDKQEETPIVTTKKKWVKSDREASQKMWQSYSELGYEGTTCVPWDSVKKFIGDKKP